jgi:predicted transcriptional regulator
MTRQPLLGMATIKISSKVEEQVWEDLRILAKESHQNVSGLLTEAISDYVHRRRIRPEVLDHLADSIDDNNELGHLLAK